MRRGNSVITTPIVLVFSIISIVVISILLINVMTPYIMYEKMLSISLRYMFVLEEYGYLTTSDINRLRSDLVEEGFKENRIQINATAEEVEYGDTVELEIVYEYSMIIPLMKDNSFNVENKEKATILRVKKYGICKK